MLSTTDHSREKAGLKYIYPVLSRRSGGISVGINLNVNNACNWQCIYCQVPNLKRGSAPPVNIDKLVGELRHFLTDVLHADFYQRENIPEQLRVIKDIAISGNGEPTTSNDFCDVINAIELVMTEFGLLKNIKCVLISNGSRVNRENIKIGLKKLSEINGEVWFKIDSATSKGIASINKVRGSSGSTLKRIKISADLCPTWVQSCFFSYEGLPPSAEEIDSYLALIKTITDKKIPIKGVLLYGVERKSMQAEASKIKKLPTDWFKPIVADIESMGIEVKLSP